VKAPGASELVVHPERLWAIARMTILEAARKKVFTVLLLFGAALVASVAFFPAVGPDARLRLIEAWSLRAAGLFTAIVALFVTGFSLPSDFETRRIYLVVTKPVSKVTVFLGRYVGFFLILVIFLAVIGGLTLAFIRLTQLATGASFPTPVAHPRLVTEDFTHAGGVQADRQIRTLGVAYGPGRELRWTFQGLDRANFPDRIQGEARLVLGSPQDQFRSSGNVVIRAGLADTKLFLQTNEEAVVTFDASAIDGAGRLTVTARCADEDGFILGTAESVVIHPRPVSFEINFLKGLGLVLIQSALVMTLTLVASARLSAPVSILLGILLYVVGSAHSYVLEGTRDIERSLQADEHGHDGGHADEIPRWLQVYSRVTSAAVLVVVPDFQHFDFGRWLLKDRALDWSELSLAGLYALPRILALVFLGMVFMLFRDFGS
jgi:hypothetical protein